MSPKHAALGGILLALCVGFDAASAEAQAVNCIDLYNRVLEIYRSTPFSPEYNQIAAAYGANCLAGTSAAPANYPPNYQPTYGGYPGYPSYPAYPSYPGYAAYPDYDYGYDYGYYGVPIGAGIGFEYGRGFRGGGFHGGGFHGGGGSHRGGGRGGRH